MNRLQPIFLITSLGFSIGLGAQTPFPEKDVLPADTSSG